MKKQIDELEKYHEEIKRKNLNQKEYIRCEIIIGADENIPYHNVEVRGVGPKEMAVFLKLLETTKEEIEKEPMVKILKSLLDEVDIPIKTIKEELKGKKNNE